MVAAWLVGGRRLTHGEFELTLGEGIYEGQIEAGARKAGGAPSDAFVVSCALPSGAALRGTLRGANRYRIHATAVLAPPRHAD